MRGLEQCFGNKYFWIFLICLFLSMILNFARSNAGKGSSGLPPEVSAEHAIVIEAVTGRAIYEKNSDDKAYPASLTKMLTCIIALENGALESVETVSREAAGAEDSYLQLKAGDKMTMRDLIMGLMLVSDNSSAVVLAESIGGNVSDFATMMNSKARDIGVKHSNFVTPNGLPAAEHYSTARDMAYIAAYAWQNDTFRDIAGRQEQVIYWTYPARKSLKVRNTNNLLGTMDGANGIKTGWTREAGGCLAASAERDGVQLIAVVMDSDNQDTRFQDAQKLLEYGFTRVERVKGLDKNDIEKSVLVAGGDEYSVTAHPNDDVYLPLWDGENANNYSIKYNVPLTVAAPVYKGQKVGNIKIYYKEQELRQIPLVADKAVPAGYNPLSVMLTGVNYIVEFIQRKLS